jgi:hypothetical protein
MTDVQLQSALSRLAPQVDDTSAWGDVVRRAGAGTRLGWKLAVVVAAILLTSGLVAGALAEGFLNGTLDRLSAWVGDHPGEPAPREQAAMDKQNARAAAPVPADTELGLLISKQLDRVRFDLLGFRDRESLCLRLRSSAGQGEPIAKAPADCVSEQLLIDLDKPLAVFAAADPFPRSRSGLQALYGLAADRVRAVQLRSEGGIDRVPVTNNAFLYLYRGEGPRLSHNRLEYKSDVPFKATALDTDGTALGAVKIMSLKRGYPAAPLPSELPGPSAVEVKPAALRVGWLDRDENRGAPYVWPGTDGTTREGLPSFRMIQPNPITSMRVLVAGRRAPSMRMPIGSGYCVTNVWPLARRAAGYMCGAPDPSGPILLGIATAVPFDAQFPIYYGLVDDKVVSLALFLSNGVRESIPIVDNVFALQAAAADPAKLVAYDEQHRVLAVQVVSLS